MKIIQVLELVFENNILDSASLTDQKPLDTVLKCGVHYVEIFRHRLCGLYTLVIGMVTEPTGGCRNAVSNFGHF
ncbi:hypothetical protein ACFX13_047854 [Malus domestica]